MPEIRWGVAASLTDEDVRVTTLASAVEDAGLESLLLLGHSHVPVSRSDLLDDPFHARHRRLIDQFTALGAAAAVTSRLRLGTGVCIVPLHDSILLAKQVATIDHVSDGRFLFGVGVGWLEEEMRNLGVQPPDRWDLMAEQLAAMREIWTHDIAEFHGTFVDFDPIWMWPKPVQSPHPPILVGGGGPRILRIAAVHGDGWLPVVQELAEFDGQLARLQKLSDDIGRPCPEVTACFTKIDEGLLEGCLDRGVGRCVVLAPTGTMVALDAFLASYSNLCQRLT